MSVISLRFASILCLDPMKVLQLQVAALLQSSQSVTVVGRVSISAKMSFNLRVMSHHPKSGFRYSYRSVLVWGEKCNQLLSFFGSSF